MKKIGRNDPCPCGSGKKYKKCCLGGKIKVQHSEDQPNEQGASQFMHYIKAYESTHLLNTLIGMQLIPENHGKNFRIEMMAAEVVKELSTGKEADMDSLQSIVNAEFPEYFMEEPPEELFTESVVFHGGNYTTLCGISPYASSIFKYLTLAMYTVQNDLSKPFKEDVYHSVFLLLNIGEMLLNRAGLERNLFVESEDSKLKLPNQLQPWGIAISQYLHWCEATHTPPETIDQFILSPDAPELAHYDDTCPLMTKPFVLYGNEYYFLLPTGQLTTLNEHIIAMAKKHKEAEELHTIIHDRIWHDIWRSCDAMNWALTDIPLPDTSEEMSIQEGLFQFDAWTLAYVCYMYPSELNSAQELHTSQKPVSFGVGSINKRIESVITELKSRPELEGYQFLTVVLLNSMGGFAAQSIHKPQSREKRTWFNVFDFITLGLSKEWDHLDLWKYAKVYEAASEESRIFTTSPLDAYATYRNNDETFYLTDEHRPDILTIEQGGGTELLRKAKAKWDEHGVLGTMGGRDVYIPVRRFREYAPIYKIRDFKIPYKLLLASYPFPIWVQTPQITNETQIAQVEHLTDAICFWLDRLSPALYHLFEAVPLPYLNITLIFGEEFFEPIPLETIDANEVPPFELQGSFENQELIIVFPALFQRIFVGGDNSGERMLIQQILTFFNLIPGLELSREHIVPIIDTYVPHGKAKMVLFLDTRTDIQLDNRWLIPELYVSKAEVNLLLDELVKFMDGPKPIPEKFETNLEKKGCCNRIVLGLTKHLMGKLVDVDQEELVKRLLQLNERLIHTREFSKVQTAAQIFCFGNDDDGLQTILQKERDLVNTSVSTRCLIEFLVHHPATGSRKPSYDDLDGLLAIMNEILNFGMLSDAIHFGMADPEMGLLPSGRIGISKEFYDDKLQPFHQDNTKANIESQMEFFSDSFGIYDQVDLGEGEKDFYDELDNAFLEDWGIDYTNLHSICFQATALAGQREASVVSMSKEELVAELHKVLNIDMEQIEIGLAKLSLVQNEKVVSSETGYTDKEYFPWKYNREFSYARRPFVVLDTDKGKKYYWGMRNCRSASRFLQQLLGSGRLTNGGPKINAILGRILETNGKNFRNEVKNWLKENTTLKVWEYEVTIKPKGHLDADNDYGDSDIFAYDAENNNVYNLECKQTSAARNIHQMKLEMDAYLGREGQKKKIAKHVARDNWLKENLELVQGFIESQKLPSIQSYIITSELIPTRYLRQDDIELPIISYRELRTHGISILSNSSDTSY